jgi:hypothetical protein
MEVAGHLMARKKTARDVAKPFIDTTAQDIGWPRPQGEFDPLPPDVHQEITLAQAKTPESRAERLRLAEIYCTLAERWITGDWPPQGPPGRETKLDNKNDGVARSFLRDAVANLAEVWLGLPATESLALIRRLVEEAR